MTCRTAIRTVAVKQTPRLAYVRHGLPGDPVEIVVVIDGRQHAVAIGNRMALDIISDLTRAIGANLTNDGRLNLCALPKAGSRG